MKLALVHDWLNTKRGGAEKVLSVLADTFPEAPIYTLIYNSDRFDYPPERIHTSSLQRLPRSVKQRSRYLLPLIPSAVEGWDFSSYDVVLSSSSAFVKNIITPEQTTHISYCHTPARFVWDYWPAYLHEQQLGPLRRWYVRRQARQFRIWDYVGAARVDAYIANSHTTARRIHRYYRREADIVHPPVEIPPKPDVDKQDYYVTLGMLTPYKKIDLAIEAFNQSGRALKIIGDGPDRARLQRLAGDNIEFLGFVDEAAKHRVVAAAQGLIFPNKEDFGIAPVEAMALGTPVIGYGFGGVTETVENGVTGVLFSKQTVDALNKAVSQAQQLDCSTERLREHAQQFRTERFQEKIKYHLSRYEQPT